MDSGQCAGSIRSDSCTLPKPGRPPPLLLGMPTPYLYLGSTGYPFWVMSSLLALFPGAWVCWSKWWNGERCWTIRWDMLWQCTQLKLANHLAQHLPLKASQNVNSYAHKWEGGSSERLCNIPNITQQRRRGRLQTHLSILKSLLFTKCHLEVHWELWFALWSLN